MKLKRKVIVKTGKISEGIFLWAKKWGKIPREKKSPQKDFHWISVFSRHKLFVASSDI